MRRHRDGVTLIELMVALAILALMAGVTMIGLRRADAPAPVTDADRIANARRDAIALGRAVRFTLGDSTGVRAAQALPDGRLIGGPSSTQDSAAREAIHAPR